MILPSWFDQVVESFSYREFQTKQFCPLVKTSCPPAEKVNKTPKYNKQRFHFKDQVLDKLWGCNNDFVHLVWPSRGMFFFCLYNNSYCSRSSVCSNTLSNLWKPVPPLLKMLIKNPEYTLRPGYRVFTTTKNDHRLGGLNPGKDTTMSLLIFNLHPPPIKVLGRVREGSLWVVFEGVAVLSFLIF